MEKKTRLIVVGAIAAIGLIVLAIAWWPSSGGRVDNSAADAAAAAARASQANEPPPPEEPKRPEKPRPGAMTGPGK